MLPVEPSATPNRFHNLLRTRTHPFVLETRFRELLKSIRSWPSKKIPSDNGQTPLTLNIWITTCRQTTIGALQPEQPRRVFTKN